MAPKKSVTLTPVAEAAPAAAAAPQHEEIVPASEEIEEIVPEHDEEGQPGFVLDSVFYDGEGEDEDEDDGEEDESPYELVTAVGQLTQLMMTEEGVAVADVLNGIRDALDKQNKILYRGVQLLEKSLSKP